MLYEKIGQFYEQKPIGKRCPGEAGCDRFQSAKGDTPERKELNACTGRDPSRPICELYPTKIKPKQIVRTKKAELMVERVLYLRQVRNSNKNFDIENLPSVFYELLIMADECFENHERTLRLGSIELAKVNAQIFSQLTQMMMPR